MTVARRSWRRAALAGGHRARRLRGRPSRPGAGRPGLSVRITSPLGRTGAARRRPHRRAGRATRRALRRAQVRFYVDEQLLGADDHGPPYAVEWVDDNPFERREIAVEVVDALGTAARDKVVLEPFEVTEAAEVTACCSRPRCRTSNGRFVKGLDAWRVLGLRGRRAADARPRAGRRRSARPSRCWSTAARACRGAWTSCSGRRRPLPATCAAGPDDRRAVLQASARSPARPTTAPPSSRASRRSRPSGGTAILDSLVAGARQILANAEGRRAHRADHRWLRRAQRGAFERRAGRGQVRRRDGVRRRHRRRRRHLDQGRAAAAAAGASRPAAGSSSRRARAARRRARRADRGRAEPLPAHLHAEEPEARRHLARDHASTTDSDGTRHPRAAGLFRAEAAADQARASSSRPIDPTGRYLDLRPPRTSRSSKTASRRRSRRFRKRCSRSRSCWRSTRAAA